MKKILDRYDPLIYPRKVWVAVGSNKLGNLFTFYDTGNKNVIENIDEDLKDDSIALAVYSVSDSNTGEYGALVYLPDIDKFKDTDIAHEAVHVADYICEELGIYSEPFSNGNEAYAYLVGWVAGCISKTVIKAKKEYDN